MSWINRFRAIDEDGKAHAVRRLISNSTPDFDYFYLVGLSVSMATLGLLVGSPSVVIGSMLIAPVLFPILSFSLGLVMSDYQILTRSFYTLLKSFGLAVFLSIIVTLVFSNGFEMNEEILSRTVPSLVYLFVAITAGLAVSYTLAKPELNEAFPGIAISVALIPPLAVVGIGIAKLSWEIVSGSLVLLLLNIFGIVAASMFTFSLMNLYEKRHIAKSTIKREEEKIKEEKEVIQELDEKEKQNSESSTDTTTPSEK